jgi:hypothetical protein
VGEGGEEEDLAICSRAEVSDMLSRIRSFFLFNDGPKESLQCIDKLNGFCKAMSLQSAKQVSILKFLKK